MSLRRIQKELEELNKEQTVNYCAGPVNDSDLFNWQATILGPKDTPYENGIFYIDIKFSKDHPFKPPLCIMKTRIYHPNLREDKKICCCAMSILGDGWNTSLTISKVLRSIYCLLIDPNIECCDNGNYEAFQLYNTDREKFNTKAKDWTKRYAT